MKKLIADRPETVSACVRVGVRVCACLLHSAQAARRTQKNTTDLESIPHVRVFRSFHVCVQVCKRRCLPEKTRSFVERCVRAFEFAREVTAVRERATERSENTLHNGNTHAARKHT